MPSFSMTGYGEGTASSAQVEISVELKAVNHRFLDVVCKMPSGYARLEADVVKLLRERLRRGRVEVSVSRQPLGQPEYELHFNQPLFEDYLKTVRKALRSSAVPDRRGLGFAVANVLNRREVLDLVAQEADSESEKSVLEKALVDALEGLCAMRAAEGAELVKELMGLLGALEKVVERVASEVRQTPIDYKAKLEQRLERITGGVEVEAERLAQEVALLADRVDVTEEITRLQSHFLQFRSSLEAGEGGRKLEFLLQEFGREINTIGSKAQNSTVTAEVVEAKAIVEKLREQVQNIE